jgi:hypothetical protein
MRYMIMNSENMQQEAIDSVHNSVWTSVDGSVDISVHGSVWSSVRDSVVLSVYDSVRRSVCLSVRDALYDYEF